LISLAAWYNLKVCIVDVVGAYLNGKLDEEIYMVQPEGYEDGTARVCKLEQSLYSLKQASHIWNLTLDSSFKKLRYLHLLSDQCVYVRRLDKGIVIVTVHVNDMSIFASNDELMDQVESELEKEFSINRLSGLHQLPGIEIHFSSDSITLMQTQYLMHILQHFGMAECKPVHTPIMDTHVKLEMLSNNESFPEVKAVYQNIVESLMFAAVMTCPDISFTVQTLSQFNTNPSPTCLTAAK
jgi:Reverse transcriptase (RNA-dependent DNA polymerase)